jgi:hypothetical protein
MSESIEARMCPRRIALARQGSGKAPERARPHGKLGKDRLLMAEILGPGRPGFGTDGTCDHLTIGGGVPGDKFGLGVWQSS